MEDYLIKGHSQEGVCVASRVEDPQPRGLRIAKYPDGSTRIQAAYMWHQGASGGFEWRDVPEVEVDENGNAESTTTSA